MPNAVLIVLYAMSFVLPTAGFVRLLTRAARTLAEAERKVAERGNPTLNMADFSEVWTEDVRDAPRRARSQLCWDVTLVGSGLLAGAVAGIASLYI